MPSLVGKQVGEVGYGLMGLTLKMPDQLPPNSQSFAAMKAALNAGATAWNGGEIYGPPEHNSLHLLNAYFTEYPEDADKIVLSIKGGCEVGGIFKGALPNGSAKNIKRSIDECLRVLDGKKFLDLFECARVDPKTPIEESMKAIKEYMNAGKIGGVSLSEVSAESIRRASKIVKISAVEMEFSLWETAIWENGVVDVCKELDIPIVAYSPQGRGFLTGEITKPEDVPEGDFRRMIPRFQGEAFYENIKLVDEVKKIAKRKGCTPGQIGIAWIIAQSNRGKAGTIIPIPGASTDKRVAENSAAKDVKLDEEDLKEIDEILKRFKPAGERYPVGEHGTGLLEA